MKRYYAMILVALIACNDPKPAKSDAISSTFDLPAYFAEEVKHLEAKKPLVQKSVWINKKEESKTVRISNWKKELSIFTDADINKKAWAGEFQKSVTDTSEQYTTANEKIPVKQVIIYKRGSVVTGINIFIRNGNYLYTSTDTLSYYPNKLYQIKKMQHIRFMNSKSYQILGKL